MIRKLTVALLTFAPLTAIALGGAEPSALPDRSVALSSVIESARDRITRQGPMPAYNINLTIGDDLRSFNFDEQLTFNHPGGEAPNEIFFYVPANAEHFMTDGKQSILFESAEVNGRAAKVTQKGTLLTVTPDGELAAGAKVVVRLRARGLLPSLQVSASMAEESFKQLFDMLGTGAKPVGNVGIFGEVGGVLNFGTWYAFLAHSRFEESSCAIGDADRFDAADYTVQIDAPKSLVIVSSGVDGESEIRGERQILKTAAAGMREFTLSASNEFEIATAQVGATTVRSIFPPRVKEGGLKTLTYAKDALTSFNAMFGEYPYKQLDVVATRLTSGVGGMEFSGLVTINEHIYKPINLSDIPLVKQFMSQGAKISEGQSLDAMLEFTVAHEVAHQWWHGMVGSDAMSAPFVDEALTNYSTILYHERIHGAKAADEAVTMNLKLPYQFYRLMGGEDGAVDQPTCAFKDMTSYGAIVYGKGPFYFKAIRDRVGLERFTKALFEYRARNEFGFVNQAKLQESLLTLTKDSGGGLTEADLLALNERWLHGRFGDVDIKKMEFDEMIETLMGPDTFKGPEGEMGRMIIRLMGPALAKGLSS